MNKVTLIVIVLFAVVFVFCFFNKETHAREGRCTGSSSCSICKNCSRCAHCSNGGFCGVCSSRRSTRNSNSSSNSSHKSTSVGSSNSNSQTKPVSKDYFVEPPTISIRKSPSQSGQILCTLKEFDSVKLIKMYDSKWAQVEIVCDSITMTGYTLKSYLIKIEN
jgi:hypothetical protein